MLLLFLDSLIRQHADTDTAQAADLFVTSRALTADGLTPTADALTPTIDAVTEPVIGFTRSGIADTTATADLPVGWARRPRGYPRFAGDIPGRPGLGFAAPQTPRTPPRLPLYDEALGILGSVPPWRRVYDSGDWLSLAKVNALAAQAEAHGALAVASWRPPGDDVAGVASGARDAELAILRDWAKARRTSGGRPSMHALLHEPVGDVDLTEWAAAQERWIDYLSGWGTGVYVPEDDVTSVLTPVVIINGHLIGPRQDDALAEALPPTLLARIERSGILLADCYDAPPTWTTAARATAWRQWAVEHGLSRIGLGEFGCTSAASLAATWAEITGNPEWAVVVYFGALGAFAGDPRPIPLGYPITDPTHPHDAGGTPTQAAILEQFQAMHRDVAGAPVPSGDPDYTDTATAVEVLTVLTRGGVLDAAAAEDVLGELDRDGFRDVVTPADVVATADLLSILTRTGLRDNGAAVEVLSALGRSGVLDAAAAADAVAASARTTAPDAAAPVDLVTALARVVPVEVVATADLDGLRDAEDMDGMGPAVEVILARALAALDAAQAGEVIAGRSMTAADTAALADLVLAVATARRGTGRASVQGGRTVVAGSGRRSTASASERSTVTTTEE